MTDSQTQAALKRAYAQIKQGDKSGAIRLIKPVLRENRDNATAWWLLANAAPKPEQAKQALNQVLRLKPGDEKAQKMLARIEMNGGTSTPVQGTAAKPPPAIIQEKDPFAVDDDPFAVLDGEPAPPLSRRTRDEIDNTFEDDPFTGVSSPSSSPITSYSGTYDTAASARTNQMIVYAIAVSGLLLIAVVFGLVVAGSGFGETSLTSQGMCAVSQEEVGYMSENVTIDCGPIGLDQRWNGELGAYQSHDWFLQAEAGQSVRIDVVSDLDDPILTVYGPDGRLIAENDDIDFGEDTNSRLELTFMQSGSYRIRVAMYFDNGGDYHIDVRDDGNVDISNMTACANSRTATDGVIACGDVQTGAVINETLPGGGVHQWWLVAEPGTAITIEMNALSDDLDTMLDVYDEQTRTEIASNDDIRPFENYDSRVRFTMPQSGRVLVSASEFGFSGGPYRLSIR